MRSQDVVRRETIRLCLSAIRNEEVARRGPLEDPAELAVLGRQARMRRESIEAFRRGGRDELVAKETAELGVIEKYLPAQLGESDVREAILRAIAETGASGPGAQGKVMQRAMVELRGRADGKLVAGVVARLLSGEGGSVGPPGPLPPLSPEEAGPHAKRADEAGEAIGDPK